MLAVHEVAARNLDDLVRRLEQVARLLVGTWRDVVVLAGERDRGHLDRQLERRGEADLERAVVAERGVEAAGLLERFLGRGSLGEGDGFPCGRPAVPQRIDVREVVRAHAIGGLRAAQSDHVAHLPHQERRRADCSRVRNRERDEQADLLGCECGGSVCTARAPVMADDDRGGLAERIDQRDEIRAERVGIVLAVRGDLGRMIAARERCDGTKPGGGDRRHRCIPGVRGVGEAVNEENERPGTLLEVGELDAVGRDQARRRAHPAIVG